MYIKEVRVIHKLIIIRLIVVYMAMPFMRLQHQVVQKEAGTVTSRTSLTRAIRSSDAVATTIMAVLRACSASAAATTTAATAVSVRSCVYIKCEPSTKRDAREATRRRKPETSPRTPYASKNVERI